MIQAAAKNKYSFDMRLSAQPMARDVIRFARSLRRLYANREPRPMFSSIGAGYSRIFNRYLFSPAL
jgi:hypothetical protein